MNCCCDIFIEEALETAKQLDETFKKTGKIVGPFHGIPISLKDQVNLEGHVSSIGFIGLLDNVVKKEDESTLTVLLRDMGAVFYVKTTVPMAMMSADTWSNAFGYTYNAINRKLSAGGSSGGEGALIGARGSILGFGTDIGGSIRIPSNFNGIFGLRPSHGRVPYQKIMNSNNGQPIMPSVIGPMAQHLEDIEYCMKNLIATEPWFSDSKVVPIPYRDVDVSGKKLTFGVMKTDGLITPHPPVKRAIDETIKAIEAAGHQVIEWEPQDHAIIDKTTGDIFRADGHKELFDMAALSGEPVTVCHGKRFEPATINEHWQHADDKYAIQKKYFDYWNDTKNRTYNGKPVDAWIAPAWESASIAPYFEQDVSTYTVTLNLLDCSVVITPVLHVDKSIDLPYTDFKPLSKDDEMINDSYNPEYFHGAPVCVQVITRRLEDEKAIAMAYVVRDCLKKN